MPIDFTQGEYVILGGLAGLYALVFHLNGKISRIEGKLEIPIAVIPVTPPSTVPCKVDDSNG